MEIIWPRFPLKPTLIWTKGVSVNWTGLQIQLRLNDELEVIKEYEQIILYLALIPVVFYIRPENTGFKLFSNDFTGPSRGNKISDIIATILFRSDSIDGIDLVRVIKLLDPYTRKSDGSK